LFGCYECIQNVKALDAIIDFTGGVGERIQFDRYDMTHDVTVKRIFEKLEDALENGAQVICHIEVSS
jgi:acetate kinase